MSIKSSILSIIDGLFFEERCVSCRKAGRILCTECLQRLPPPERDLPDYIFALYEYRNNIVKKLLTDAKYRKKFDGLKVFGQVLASAVIEIVDEKTELNNYSRIILIPIPISRKRLKSRGFNQTKILATELMKNLDNNSFLLGAEIVLKIKNKTPQASIKNRSQRLKSPIDTFKVTNSEILKDALCIVIDDITTTGGTIKEVRRILKESGARDAVGLTVAH